MNTDLASAIADLMHQLQAEQVRGYRVETVAGLLDVPYRTVMALIHSGQLGHVMAGRYYLVPHAELQRYLAGAAAASRRNEAARGPLLITPGPQQKTRADALMPTCAPQEHREGALL